MRYVLMGLTACALSACGMFGEREKQLSTRARENLGKADTVALAQSRAATNLAEGAIQEMQERDDSHVVALLTGKLQAIAADGEATPQEIQGLVEQVQELMAAQRRAYATKRQDAYALQSYKAAYMVLSAGLDAALAKFEERAEVDTALRENGARAAKVAVDFAKDVAKEVK